MSAVLPILVLLSLGYALSAKRPVFDDFCDGVRNGLRVCASVFPTLLLMLVSLSVFRASGALNALIDLAAPLLSPLGIPTAVLPVALLRPISGGGALSACEQALRLYGADSQIGKITSVICSSSETTLYVLGLYLNGKSPKGVGRVLLIALICDFACAVLSVAVCGLPHFG